MGSIQHDTNSQFANKVFCLTGAAAGIGLSTANALLERGASVAVCDINQTALEKAYSSLDNGIRESRLFSRQVDVADRAQVKDFLAATKARFGRLDGVANIAGAIGNYFGLKELWESPSEEYDRVMDVNVRGTFNFVAEAMAPGILENGSSIVNIGSTASMRGYNKGAIYSMSKHAVIGLTKSAAFEGGSRDIRVNIVLPGPVNTYLLNKATENFGALKRPTAYRPIQRFGEVSELSNVIVFLLGPESTFVTGAVWPVDGGSLA